MSPKEIGLKELNARLHSTTPPVLLEALPAKYYQDWHLPGAHHMPHDEARALAATLVPDKRTPIVVYCASATCRNSHIAASVLAQLGYEHVEVFTGGKQAWSEAGLRSSEPSNNSRERGRRAVASRRRPTRRRSPARAPIGTATA